MRTFLPGCDLRPPSTLTDALAWLAVDPQRRRPFAGGTDLMVLAEAGRLPHTQYVSLWGLAELRGIRIDGDTAILGALTTYTDVLREPVMEREFPLVCRAAAETGGWATQNRGTLGGNIANASPAADTPPTLLVYDAELELASMGGTRRVPYHRFHTGYKAMDLAPEEIITAIRLPRERPWTRQTFRKIGARRGQAISKLCMAAALRLSGDVVEDVRVAFGAVAPTVVRAHGAEAILRSGALGPSTIAAACEVLGSDLRPIDDMRSTSQYRLQVARNLLREFLVHG